MHFDATYVALGPGPDFCSVICCQMPSMPRRFDQSCKPDLDPAYGTTELRCKTLSIPIKYNAVQDVHEGENPLVIIGPNGSGKTRYGLRLVDWNDAEIIPAFRNIAIDENIPIQSLERTEQELERNTTILVKKPWNISSEINHLFSKLMLEDSVAAVEFRDQYHEGVKPAITKLMQLRGLWQALFPGRKIAFSDYNPKVTSEYVTGEQTYLARSMSDGERVALYLTGRVLNAKFNIIIVDEPEVHFHSRLAMQFWDELEKIRSDCRFVYITHDLHFAQSRKASGYLIIKKPEDPPQILSAEKGIPHEVVKEILSAASFSIYANRIIFCEGSESSYDQKIFRAYYNNRLDAVVPVGSCRDVVKCADVFAKSNIVSGMTAIGIIDRDYWPDAYLNSLPDHIYALPVHEIESLLCLKGIFLAVALHLGKTLTDAEALYENFLSEALDKFSGEQQVKLISERFKQRCTTQFRHSINSLKIFENQNETRENHKESLSVDKWPVSPESIFNEETEVVNSAFAQPAKSLIKVLPGKVYLSVLVKKLGIDKNAYTEIISTALCASSGDPLYTLGSKIRDELNKILPGGQ